MPTAIIKFKCDNCQSEYEESDEAANCERNHFTIDNFNISEISSESAINKKFPKTIIVDSPKSPRAAKYKFINSSRLFKKKLR